MFKKIIYSIVILFCLLSIASAADITLGWDVPTEDIAKGDFAGWRIYSSLTSGTGYQFMTNGQIDYTDVFDYKVTVSIPEVVGDSVTYYFVVTAFDTSGNESGYSNEVSKEFSDTTPPSVTVNVHIIEQ